MGSNMTGEGSSPIKRDRPSERSDGKFHIRSRFKGKCAGCNKSIAAGTIVLYMPEDKAVWHEECGHLPKRTRVGYSGKATRNVGLNGGAGSRNRRVR